MNLIWGNSQQQQQSPPPAVVSEKGGSSLKDVIKHMAEDNTQFQHKTSEIVQRTDERIKRT